MAYIVGLMCQKESPPPWFDSSVQPVAGVLDLTAPLSLKRCQPTGFSRMKIMAASLGRFASVVRQGSLGVPAAKEMISAPPLPAPVSGPPKRRPSDEMALERAPGNSEGPAHPGIGQTSFWAMTATGWRWKPEVVDQQQGGEVGARPGCTAGRPEFGDLCQTRRADITIKSAGDPQDDRHTVPFPRPSPGLGKNPGRVRGYFSSGHSRVFCPLISTRATR
jgi:hypothetical protein